MMDVVYFKSRWNDYKKATGITGDDIITQLMECCCDSIRRDHHRTFSKAEGESVPAITEEARLKELKQLAVRKKNKAVNRVKVGTLRQDKGEPVRKFSGRVPSLAAVSEYAVKCKSCNKDDYKGRCRRSQEYHRSSRRNPTMTLPLQGQRP